MKSVAVIGLSGAIGSGFISSYFEDEATENIISFSRSSPMPLFLNQYIDRKNFLYH